VRAAKHASQCIREIRDRARHDSRALILKWCSPSGYVRTTRELSDAYFHIPPLSQGVFCQALRRSSRYWFTIVSQEYLALGGWSPMFRQRFNVRRSTRFHTRELFVYGAYHPMGGTIPGLPLTLKCLRAAPRCSPPTWGISG